jgi:hypothetical protein
LPPLPWRLGSPPNAGCNPEPDTKFSAMLHDALTWIAPPCAQPTSDRRRKAVIGIGHHEPGMF